MYLLGYKHHEEMNNGKGFINRPSMNKGIHWLDPLWLQCVGRFLPTE